MWDVPLFPDQASTVAGRVDAIYLALWALSAFFIVLIGALLFRFAIRYRAGSKADRSPSRINAATVETALLGGPLIIALAIFFWAAHVFFEIQRAPDDTLDIYVVGKQWMWSVQHPGGQREKNELHVPVGQPIRLIMTSDDVIHSFYVPAFRVKQDVLPDRDTTLWFEATKPGEYHLFCAEFCGTEHSRMIGKVIVMEPRDYQAWLGPAGVATGPAPVAGGAMRQPDNAFTRKGCNACHRPDSDIRAPRLEGLFGGEVNLRNGETVIVDEAYIRESILEPNAKIAAGYPSPSLMPPYRGQISEDDLAEITEYIKSLARTQDHPHTMIEPSAPPVDGPAADPATSAGDDAPADTSQPATTDQPEAQS